MKLTIWLLVAGVFIVGILDIILLASKGEKATFSSVIYNYSKKYPIIAFTLGVLAGHLFWTNR